MPSGDAVLLFGIVVGAVALVWIIISFNTLFRSLLHKGPLFLRPLLHEFEQLIAKTERGLLQIRESEAAQKPPEGKWSKKEILGHLIDSASNNHQRFVRAQLSSEIRLPGYVQSEWVKTQKYQAESWTGLVSLWSSYNRHLVHVIASVPAERLKERCFIGDDEPVTLEFLIRDYVRHLEHHCKQLLP